jgi:hypothetical protein
MATFAVFRLFLSYCCSVVVVGVHGPALTQTSHYVQQTDGWADRQTLRQTKTDSDERARRLVDTKHRGDDVGAGVERPAATET